MVGVGKNQSWTISLPSVMEPRHSWHHGHRAPAAGPSWSTVLDLSTPGWVWIPQNTANHDRQERERASEGVSERKKQRKRGREGALKRENKKGIWLLLGKKRNKKDIIISKYIAYTFQNIFESTTARFSNYLFIYTPSCSKEVLKHFAARLIFLKLSSDHVTPLLKPPIAPHCLENEVQFP